MGCSCSSSTAPIGETKNEEPKQNGGGNEITDSGLRAESALKYDEINVNRIRKILDDNPEHFVLNNLLMSMQFFVNHQKEIIKLQHTTASKMEKDLNRTLLKDETMECTNPDLIFDIVKENVRFRPLHGPKTQVLEPIIPRRIYVINDSIEVLNSSADEVPQYTHIDRPAYQARIEESGKRGFVKLKFIGNTNFLENNKKSVSVPSSPLNVDMPSTSSYNNDSVYEYSTITEIKTPKPLEISNKPERRDTLPETCFTERKTISGEFDPTDEDISEDDLYETTHYINSSEFMNYFQNALFPNSLGRTLGFDETEISLAKSIPGKIFCNMLDDDDNIIPCEVIPSVAIEWPTEQTYEFLARDDRPIITDTRTGVRYKWPTDDMIRDLRNMSCVLVPKGFQQKKGTYLDTDIEWELNFPKAERYLEARMSHPQMRCFLMLLTIHKSFIEPVTEQQGLLPEHIRIHMYWECEANYKDWPEHRLATKLLRIIKNLHDRLSRGILPNFFIKQKNMFEDIPRKYLRFAQRVLHDVLQSPTTYLLRATRNLRYTNGKFYPPLDFQELRNILTSRGIALANPNILNSTPPNIRKFRRYEDPETQLKHIAELKRRDEIIKQKQEEKENHSRIDFYLDFDDRRTSVDSIDIDLSNEKKFDMYKKRAVLQFFIKMFIDIAKSAMRLSSYGLSAFYLKQATYLAQILQNIVPAFIEEAREFMEIISKEDSALKLESVRQSTEYPPSTPIRNSISFDFNQQLKNNVVNLHNLHHSFNSTMVPNNSQHFVKNKPVESRNLPQRKSVAFSANQNEVQAYSVA